MSTALFWAILACLAGAIVAAALRLTPAAYLAQGRAAVAVAVARRAMFFSWAGVLVSGAILVTAHVDQPAPPVQALGLAFMTLSVLSFPALGLAVRWRNYQAGLTVTPASAAGIGFAVGFGALFAVLLVGELSLDNRGLAPTTYTFCWGVIFGVAGLLLLTAVTAGIVHAARVARRQSHRIPTLVGSDRTSPTLITEI